MIEGEGDAEGREFSGECSCSVCVVLSFSVNCSESWLGRAWFGRAG
jgi:hypothetical protein